MLDSSGVAWQRRTALDGVAERREGARVLLVDVVGELGAWWGTAQIALVGGSLGSRGGQNMIEPAAYGAAVAFGPNTWNFRDIVTAMLDRQAALVIRSGDELTAFVRRSLEDPAWAAGLGHRARALVAEQLGATERSCRLLEPLVAPMTDEAERGRAVA
jgi:3-deoxy-D-manno-octulosonic-acid transferase